MSFAKNIVWINPERRLCVLQEDGSVEFEEDVTISELKWAVSVFLRENQKPKLKDCDKIFKCPSCKCQAGCCCCKEGYCGCKENYIQINEDGVF